MKLVKSLIATMLLVAGTSAFAGSQVKSVIRSGQEQLNTHGLFGTWSTVCVANTQLQQDVVGQYQYDGEAQPTDITIAQNTVVMFYQWTANDIDPSALTFNFIASNNGTEASLALDQTQTRLKPFRCDNLDNYAFEGTDGATIDLVKVQ